MKKIDWNDWDGQGILHLKVDTLTELTNEDKMFAYKLEGGGFPEDTVNRLMYAAFEMGRNQSRAEAAKMRADIVDNLMGALEKLK